MFQKNQKVKLLETVECSGYCLQFNPDFPGGVDRQLITANGEVTFLLKLTLDIPAMSDLEHDHFKMEQFLKNSVEQLRQNQATLLNSHPENADLKIICRDEIEIPAHRTILRGD